MTGILINPRGSFSRVVFDTILDRIRGGESVKAICSAPPCPCAATFYRWLNRIEGLTDEYIAACEARAGLLAEQCLDIADDVTSDYVVQARRDGSVVTIYNSENVQRAKLRIDARKWSMAVMKLKRYGCRDK